MKVAYLSAATLAATLLAGAAHATMQTPRDPEPRPQDERAAAAARNDPSLARPPQRSSDPNAVVNVTIVTNGPIPDTPENRARFGKPLSNAGRNSKPAGN